MKRILCFGDSNTWGYNAKKGNRFSEKLRWPCLLQKKLGKDYKIIEEGLNGRTAAWDDPLFEGLNGYKDIISCIESHLPLELVIIMLGTNDAKERMNLTSYNIAQGIVKLSLKAYDVLLSNGLEKPKVLVVSPPAIGKKYYGVVGTSMGKACDIKSENLGVNLFQLLEGHPIEFLDLKGLVEMGQIDYMHLDKKGHRLVSKLIFDKIKSIL